MPFVEYIALDGQDIIGLWRNDEELEDLLIDLNPSPDLQHQLNQIKLEKRKKEFCITHLLLRELVDEDERIIKDEYGKPMLVHHEFAISISHADLYSAILLSEHLECGVDVEVISARINRVANKFVSSYEDLYVSKNNSPAYYTVIWCVKEAIYKWYAKRGLDFIENMIIHPFTLQQSGGPVYYEFVKDGLKRTRIAHYFCFNSHVVAWVLDEIWIAPEQTKHQL